MKNILVTFFVAISSIPVTETWAEEASDFAIVGGASFGFKNVKFDVSDKRFDPQFITLDVAFTAAYKRVYLTLDYDSSIKDYVEHNKTPDGSGGIDNSTLIFSRLDYSATLGYNVWRDLNLFAGYKYGETRVNMFSNENVIGGSKQARINEEISFREKGPFIGTSYAFRFNKGSLLLSVAFAKMEGKFVISNLLDKLISEGDTTGLSYGLGWSGPLAGNMSYSLGYKGHRYRYKQDTVTDPTEDFDSDVVYNMLYLGIANYF